MMDEGPCLGDILQDILHKPKREEAQTMKYSVLIYTGNRKIAAIKALRSATAVEGKSNILGLKEAKDIVESGTADAFTVIMTIGQFVRFMQSITTDNQGFLWERHMRVLAIDEVQATNDISYL